MEPANPTLEDDIPGLRKRKWSPVKEESEDESFTCRSATETREDSATPGTLLGSDTEASHKRLRIQDASHPAGTENIPGPLAKEIPRVSQLPLDVWQHICSFLEPTSLGRLICVDRTLNALLDSRKPVPEHMIKKNLTQNDIWSASRKRLLPGFPRPLSWISELDTWKLLLGKSCQFCERKPSKPSSTIQSPWNSGPGQEGVRIIWPFAVRSCGKCLTTRMTKDADLRFSDVSILLPGLPYAYLTFDLNFITSVALRASSPPLGLDLTRYYFLPQVDQLKQDMDHAASLGRAAVEEWVKGLDDVGRQKMEDAKRFEHWEATGGLQALFRSRPRNVLPPKSGLPAMPALPALSLPSVPTHMQAQSNSGGSRIQSPLSAQNKPSPPGINHLSGIGTPQLPLKPTSPAPGQPLTGHPQPGTTLTHTQGPRGRPERSVGDVYQRKAERRAEIERRCLQLDPPIKPSTLPYMDAFINAMQISMTLNDNAWEVLKPRLVAQHDSALRKEEDFLTMNKNFQPQAEQRRENEEQLRQAQILLERQHDETQRPVREKLAAYADELIRSDWGGGAGVVKENAPQFAADLLIYVRRKFVEILDESGRLLETHGSLTASNSLESHTDQHLTLEDMKWVYETKIKPITQHYSKEIFLCGACEFDRKHYALDAVIQHYAAKHTHTFSHGSATVYWKADWPLVPPFDPKPIRSPRNRPLDHNGVSPMYQRDFGRPQHVDPIFASPEQTYHARSGVTMTPDMAPRPLARYAASAYSVDEEIYQPRTRLVPVQANVSRSAVYANGAGYETYYVPVSPASPAFSTHGLPAGPYRGRPTEVYQRPYPVQRYDSSMMSPAGMNGYGPQPSQVNQGSRLDHRPLTHPGQPSGFHQIQIAELARNARAIWDGTDGIDDLPDSVRTHVIIHHVVLRFHEKYTNEPTLTLFTDALLNNSQVKPLTTLDGLICKACTSQNDNSSQRRTQYTLPDLLKHFQTIHVEGTIPPMIPYTDLEIPRPDWKFDMVQLPDERSIKNLIHSPGMTDSKLHLIATVLSRYFEHPRSRLDRAPQTLRSSASIPPTDETARPPTRPTSPSISQEDVRNYIPLDEHPIDSERRPAITVQDHQGGQSAISAPREDEYDPHRPAAPRTGPFVEYNYDFEPPRSSVREPLRSRYDLDDRDAPPPPYVLRGGASPRRSFYNDDTYGPPLHRDSAPRRRYIEDDHDVHMRYVPNTSQYLHRPTREKDIGFDVERERERARDTIPQVKTEEARTPPRDSATGTAQFLSSFIIDGESADHRGTLNEASLPDRGSNNASSNRTGRNLAGPRHLRDRLEAQDRPGTGIASRNGTPRKAISRGGASARSRSPSAVPREDPRFAEAHPYLRHPANAVFDHEPIQQAQYTDPRYAERSMYEDELIPQHYIPVNEYKARSPSLSQPNIPLRYVEARPLARYNYPDNHLYEQPAREYVQVMPLGGPQQIEHHMVQENFPQYVEHGATYGRAIDDRGGQAYHGAPPPRREVRYDPYDDRRRYQG